MNRKILVNSIPSWNQHTGSNTFSSLFQSCKNCDLANIYISGDIPDTDVCSRYFHIHEMKVIKSIFNRNVKTGYEIDPKMKSQIENVAKSNSLLSKLYSKRCRLLLWLREFFWRFGQWNSKELNSFICDFNPDVFVFPIESYPYFNRLNYYIIQRYKPKKVIGYLWDDNFTYKQHPYDIFYKVERFFLRKQVRKLIASCTDVFAISPKMKKECDKEFGIKSIVLTKPIFNNVDKFKQYKVTTPIRILYTGKLIIGRYETILKIVKAIKDINKDGQKVILEVYTQTPLSDKKRKSLEIPECCVLNDPVPQSEIFRLQKEADVLLFAESLSHWDLTARLSFSTKLTDYFATGKCIWAVGNLDLGPIDYIKQENAGFVSSNEIEIKSVLQNMIENTDLISAMAEKGYQCGLQKHSFQIIMNTLNTVIDNI